MEYFPRLRKEERRVDDIRRLFEEQGWCLFVWPEDRQCWAAWFLHEKVGPDVSDVVRRLTAVKAAEAAWEKFSGRPHLVSSR
jgi:hypothetical protein